MNSSGIKRGLATAAISALAVVGLPGLTGTAYADDLASQAPAADAVDLLTPTTMASIKNDGVNQTVHLLATGGADVVQVKFSFSSDGGTTWTDIKTAARANGAFSAEWTPPVGVYNTTVQVKATPINNVNVEFGTADTENTMVSGNAESIDITNGAGSEVGVFQQPYAGPNDKLLGAVSTTTSDVAANPDVMLSALGGGPALAEDIVGTPAAGSNAVSGSVDFTGYSFDGTDPKVDEAVVMAEAGGSDAEAVTLYKQNIASLTAVVKESTVQGAGTTEATVTVKDQRGNPVAGAEIFRASDTSGTQVGAAKYTNSMGQVTFDNLDGTAAGKKHYFYVNTTSNGAYEPADDRRVDVTVTSYEAAVGTLTTDSADGDAFDVDENAAGDISGVLKDQNGAPLAGKNVSYVWNVAPFAETAGYPKDLPQQSATTGAGGKVNFALPGGQPSGTYTLHAFFDTNGTPGQQDGEVSATDLVIKVGQAEIEWASGLLSEAQAGTTATRKGAIALEDGTPLPGRNTAIAFAAVDNAVLAAQAAQPAGTTRTSNNTATATSGADGTFGVAVSDPKPAAPAEAPDEWTVLQAAGANTPDIGNSQAAPAVHYVYFLKDLAVDNEGTTTHILDDELDGDATPGRPVELKVTVQNAAGQPLTDLPVDISTDHGFFTPNAEDGDAGSLSELTPDPAGAEGAEYGQWKDLGNEISDETDDSGQVTAIVAIERDAGFDDDGNVTATVTFEVGGEEIVKEVDFNSFKPMNPGEVTIELSDDQDSAILPDAQSYLDTVNYDVHATDSFGNLTRMWIDLADDNPDAEISDTNVQSQWADPEFPAFYASTPDDTTSDQVVTGTWAAADTNVWTDADTGTDGFQEETGGNDGVKSDSADVTGSSDAINWYTVDRDASTYTLTHTGGDTQKVGEVVKTTFKAIDQKGQPIDSLNVSFFRSGPDDLQDGDGDGGYWTNAKGEVTYIYQGAKPGDAVVTVLAEDWHDQLIDTAELSSTVTFEGEVAPPAAKKGIVAKLFGTNNGKKADRVNINAPSSAEGARVTLYRIVKGKKKQVAAGFLNRKGNKTFTVRDRNGAKKTKYVAVVKATDVTKGDTTNKKKLS